MSVNPSRETLITVLHGGSIIGHPDADTIVLERDRIRLVGRAEELSPELSASADVAHVYLDGRFVMPGFIDAHIHLLHTGLVESGWQTCHEPRRSKPCPKR